MAADGRRGGDPLAFAVLQNRTQIAAARRELRTRELWRFPGLGERLAAQARRRLQRSQSPLSDPLKSWDVLLALEAIRSRVGTEGAVLDVGSVACPILPSLHRLGYGHLVGIDLDQSVRDMPHAGEIDYRIGDLTLTGLPAAGFAAVSAISVIEHGVPEHALLSEVRRLLQPGGIFVFSTDYWPQKIETTGIELFGLPWRIFSASELAAFVRRAGDHDLIPIADPSGAIRQVGGRPIRFGGRCYTFLFGAFVAA